MTVPDRLPIARIHLIKRVNQLHAAAIRAESHCQQGQAEQARVLRLHRLRARAWQRYLAAAAAELGTAPP